MRRLGERELIDFFRRHYVADNLTMVVADKTREIGILKAMGMAKRAVARFDKANTEHLSLLLAEMQVVARAHPGGRW